MKRLLSMMLIVAIILSGCGTVNKKEYTSRGTSAQSESISESSSESIVESSSESESSSKAVELIGASESQQANKNQNVKISGNLEVHFIDVGQADSTLILNGSKTMLIDAGNADDGTSIVSYLKGKNLKEIDYFILTHPHEDHIGGAQSVLNSFDVKTVIMPKKEHTSKTFANTVKAISSEGCKVIAPKPSEEYQLGEAEFTVLGPSKSYEELNNNSIVVRLVFGGTSFMFTGDAEIPAEKDILSRLSSLESDVLKVGHHGSQTSSSYQWLREVNPSHAVVSVGRNNTYGLPDEVVLSRINDLGAKLYRTDEQGTIIATSNGKEISFNQVGIIPSKDHTEGSGLGKIEQPKQEQPKQEQSQAPKSAYIGNINSHKFHRSSCRSLPDEQNRCYLDSKEDAIGQGYDPCKICKP